MDTCILLIIPKIRKQRYRYPIHQSFGDESMNPWTLAIVIKLGEAALWLPHECYSATVRVPRTAEDPSLCVLPVYVCMYVCMYVHVCTCMHINVCVHACRCQVLLHTLPRVQYQYMECNGCMYTRTLYWVCMYVSMYINAYTYAYT